MELGQTHAVFVFWRLYSIDIDDKNLPGLESVLRGRHAPGFKER
jgi:hypothetical protein